MGGVQKYNACPGGFKIPGRESKSKNIRPMKKTFTLESSSDILNGSKVVIRGKDQTEIDRKKQDLEKVSH